jgi:cytochrome c553
MKALVAVMVATAASIAPYAHAQVDAAANGKTQLCESCHGPNGNSTNPGTPILAGQTARYIDLELQDYKAGRRHSPKMEPIAQSLSSDDMLALADYFSKQNATPAAFNADPAKVAAGATVAANALCTMCHGGDFVGQNEIPRLAGQHYAYVKKELTDFKTRQRTNDAGSMTSVAASLSDEQIDDLAQYVANQ